MKRLLVWLFKCAAALGGIALLACVAVLLVNQGDDELNPKVAAFLKRERTLVPETQNAYFHVLGLGAAPGEDAHAAGRRWAAAVAGTQALKLAGKEATWPPAPTTVPKLPALCEPDRASCVRWLKEHSDVADKVLRENQQLVTRYRALHDYPRYEEVADVKMLSHPMPPYLPFLTAHRLFLMDVAFRLSENQAEAALADLRSDIAFGRRLLAGSHSIVHKAVASAHVARSVLFASDVMHSTRNAGTLAEVLGPLTDSERRQGSALRGEMALAVTALDPSRTDIEAWGFNGDSLDTLLLKYLFQYHATLNLLYSGYYAPAVAIDALPAAQFETAAAAARAAQPDVRNWRVIYNPIGKLVVAPNLVPGLIQFIARLHDLDALVRLVGLQAEIVGKGIGDGSVGTFVASSSAVNPYSGKPFSWDGKSRQIYFAPHHRYLKDRKIGGVAGRVSVALGE